MCTNVTLNASRITPNVMLVVDGSLSMVFSDIFAMTPAYYPPDSMTTTRWDAIRTALTDMTMGVVPQLQGLVKFGLAVFGTESTCPLPLGVVMPALNNYDAINSGIAAMPPGLYTPTGLALNEVVDMMPAGVSNDPDVQVEPQIIVLATDGDPNDCLSPMTNYQPSIDAAMKAQSKGQKLFVVSVGKDAAAAHLQEMANIGAGMDRAANPGAPVFYPENAAELAATLSELIGKELSCEVTLEGKGVMPGRECEGKVTINGTELPCNGTDGWRLNDPFHIELLGAPCEMFKMSASAMLIANFPCNIVLE